MEQNFNTKSHGTKMTDYVLAKTLYDRLRWGDAQDAVFSITKSLIVPLMEPLGTGAALVRVERALDPATDNIDTECRFTRPDEGVQWSLRDAVFPNLKNYAETGSEGNRTLAGILNRLVSLSGRDFKDGLKRTGDTVVHLPESPESQRIKNRLERGAAFKEKTKLDFEREFARLLYTDSVGVGTEINYALHRMPEFLKDGQEIAKAMTDVINHAGAIGKMMAYHGRYNPGFTLEEAVRIRSTPPVARKEAPSHDKI